MGFLLLLLTLLTPGRGEAGVVHESFFILFSFRRQKLRTRQAANLWHVHFRILGLISSVNILNWLQKLNILGLYNYVPRQDVSFLNFLTQALCWSQVVCPTKSVLLLCLSQADISETIRNLDSNLAICGFDNAGLFFHYFIFYIFLLFKDFFFRDIAGTAQYNSSGEEHFQPCHSGNRNKIHPGHDSQTVFDPAGWEKEVT